MRKIKISETQFKILHLLDKIPKQNKTTAFLSAKLQKHPNTIRLHLTNLESQKLVLRIKSETGRVFWYLNKEVKNKINNCCCC